MVDYCESGLFSFIDDIFVFFFVFFVCFIIISYFLVQDDTPGALRVKKLTGEYIPADPIPGTFVMNIGDMLKVSPSFLLFLLIFPFSKSKIHNQNFFFLLLSPSLFTFPDLVEWKIPFYSSQSCE